MGYAMKDVRRFSDRQLEINVDRCAAQRYGREVSQYSPLGLQARLSRGLENGNIWNFVLARADGLAA